MIKLFFSFRNLLMISLSLSLQFALSYDFDTRRRARGLIPAADQTCGATVKHLFCNNTATSIGELRAACLRNGVSTTRAAQNHMDLPLLRLYY